MQHIIENLGVMAGPSRIGIEWKRREQMKMIAVGIIIVLSIVAVFVF